MTIIKDVWQSMSNEKAREILLYLDTGRKTNSQISQVLGITSGHVAHYLIGLRKNYLISKEDITNKYGLYSLTFKGKLAVDFIRTINNLTIANMNKNSAYTIFKDCYTHG